MPNTSNKKEPAGRPALVIPTFKQIIAEGNAEIIRRANALVQNTISTQVVPDPKQLRELGDDGTRFFFNLLKTKVLEQVGRAAESNTTVPPKTRIGASAAVKAKPTPKPTSRNRVPPTMQAAAAKQAPLKSTPNRKRDSNAVKTTSDWIDKQYRRRSGPWIAMRSVLLAAVLVAASAFLRACL